MANLLISKKMIIREMINLLVEDNQEFEEDDDFINLVVIQKIIKEELTERIKAVRIKNYFEEVVPNYRESTFRIHFRMTRSGVEKLSNILHQSAHLRKQNQGGKPMVDITKQM